MRILDAEDIPLHALLSGPFLLRKVVSLDRDSKPVIPQPE